MSGLRIGDRATLHYRLECSGRIIVDTFDAAPETFTLGMGEIDPHLEALLLGIEAGVRRVFDLGPGEAFGLRDEELLQRMPVDDFESGRILVPNAGVQFELPNGQTLNGTIIEAGPETVLVDFNHPLAGLPVRFEVQILAIEPS